MKTDNSIRDYYYMDALNEGLSEWIKGFWEWLTGKYNKGEYDPENDAYDHAKKVKYINKQKSDTIKSNEIKDDKVLKKIIDRTIDDNDPEAGFRNTHNMIEKNKALGKINSTNKWISFIFNSKEFRDCAGLVAFTLKDKDFPDTVVIYFSEFLEDYENVLNNEYIFEELRKLNKYTNTDQVILKDKKLIKRFNSDERIEINEIEGKKNIYKL